MNKVTLHLKEIEDRATLLQIALTGLKATYGSDPSARADFDAVVHAAAKLTSHIHGVRVAYEDAEGGSRA